VNSRLTLKAPSKLAMTSSLPTRKAAAPAPSGTSSGEPGATGRMSEAATSPCDTEPARTMSSASRSAVVPQRSEPPRSAVSTSGPRSVAVARSVALDFSR